MKVYRSGDCTRDNRYNDQLYHPSPRGDFTFVISEAPFNTSEIGMMKIYLEYSAVIGKVTVKNDPSITSLDALLG